MRHAPKSIDTDILPSSEGAAKSFWLSGLLADPRPVTVILFAVYAMPGWARPYALGGGDGVVAEYPFSEPLNRVGLAVFVGSGGEALGAYGLN